MKDCLQTHAICSLNTYPLYPLKYIVFRIFQELRKEWRRILDEKYNVSEKKTGKIS